MLLLQVSSKQTCRISPKRKRVARSRSACKRLNESANRKTWPMSSCSLHPTRRDGLLGRVFQWMGDRNFSSLAVSIEGGNSVKNRLQGVGFALACFARESGQAFCALEYLQRAQ